MSEQQSTITQDIENLFKKTTEANKLFLTESVKFVKQLSSSKIKGEELFTTQKQLLKDAVNLFVKLNIQYTSNLIDLGVAVTKRLNQNLNTKENSSSEQRDSSDNKPAFVLNISGAAGETVMVGEVLTTTTAVPFILLTQLVELLVAITE